MTDPDPIAVIERMLADMRGAPEAQRPAPYWSAHVDAIMGKIRARGLDRFRADSPDRAKGIAAFSGATPLVPSRRYRPRLWRTLAALARVAGLARFARACEAAIADGYASARSQWTQKLRLAHALVAVLDPELARLEDLTVGAPETIEIDGCRYSEAFLDKALELAELRPHLDLPDDAVVVEIGGGFGALAELFLRTNPRIAYVLVDIAPTLGFAEHYLSTLFPGEVAGYDATHAAEAIDPRRASRRIACVASFDVDKLAGEVDLLINSASFQETSTAIVEAYAARFRERTRLA